MSVHDSQLYSSTTVCSKYARGAARHCSEIHYKQVQNRQVQLYSQSSRAVFSPNSEAEILDVLAPCPIISGFTVLVRYLEAYRGETKSV